LSFTILLPPEKQKRLLFSSRWKKDPHKKYITSFCETLKLRPGAFFLYFFPLFFVLLVKHANGPAADFNLSALPFSFGMLCRLLSLVFTCVKSRIDANVLSLYKDVEEEEAILYVLPFLSVFLG
jgi:hypothetical protein